MPPPPPGYRLPPPGRRLHGARAAAAAQSSFWPRIFIQLPFASDMQGAPDAAAASQTSVRGYGVAVHPAVAPAASVISIPSPFFGPTTQRPTESYDVAVRLPDSSTLVYRVTRVSPGTPLPPSLMLNLILLVAVLVIALYVVARGITLPLVAACAGGGQPRAQHPCSRSCAEEGARELRHAARAFNTMQDRLHRYLDSRTRVLAAMSHDLKTPLTRLRLQVETQIDDPALQARFGKELDEMENMVHGALALFRNLNDDEALEPVDVNLLLETVRGEFAEMGKDVTLEGRAFGPLSGKPQALKRCITNLVANAVKFGSRARMLVRDGATARDQHLRRRTRESPPRSWRRCSSPSIAWNPHATAIPGARGLGLSIARDVAQAHGGSAGPQESTRGGPGGPAYPAAPPLTRLPDPT